MKFSGDKFEARNTNFYITIGRSAKVERPIFLNNLSYFLPQGTQSFYTKYTSIRLSQKSRKCTENTICIPCVHCAFFVNLVVKSLSQKPRKCTDFFTQPLPGLAYPCRRQPLCPLRVSPTLRSLCYLCVRCG
jgi:hypothetical protein